MNLACPPSMAAHVQKVLRGEYEVSYQHPHPVILDIGANVGSFAAWAMQRWPGCFIRSEIDILSRLPGIDLDVVMLE